MTRSERGRLLRLALAGALAAAIGCGDDATAPTPLLLDHHRFAQFTADGRTVVYFRQDERLGGLSGIFRVHLESGDVELVIRAILAGFSVHPVQDQVIFSARAQGESEPALWLMGVDGTGLRRVIGDGATIGHRWPAWSADGRWLAWEVRPAGQSGLDTARTLWIGEWRDSSIANGQAIGSGRRSAWRPDGRALVVERRRPGGETPHVIAVLDTSGALLDTLGLGASPVWRPDGAEVAYLAEGVADRGCLGVCFVEPTGGVPRPLSSEFMSYPGAWSRDGREFVYARFMRVYPLSVGGLDVRIDETRLWIRALATGADRQITF
jgi:Tol biopolymer transport system component